MFETKTIIHCHSDHSIKDGGMTIQKLVARAKEVGALSITLTDHGTCTGWIEFMSETRSAGINGIPGCEIFLETKLNPKAHLILLAKNYRGYQEISNIISDANRNLVNNGGIMIPVVKMNQLCEIGSNGNVIATTACINGPVGSVLLSDSRAARTMHSLQKKLNKYADADDIMYHQLISEEMAAEQRVHDLEAERDRLSDLASKKYTKRLKAINVFPDAERMKAETEILKEQEESENAKKLFSSVREEIKRAKRSATAIRQKKKRAESSRERYVEISGQIEKLKNSLLTEEEKETEGYRILEELLHIFGKNLYAEMQYHGLEDEEYVMPILANMAHKAGIPLIAANDAHIDVPSSAEGRAVLRSLRFDRWQEISESDKELYIKTNDDLSASLRKILDEESVAEAIENANGIGDMCHVEIPDEKHYPKFSEKAPELLRRAAEDGIRDRYPGDSFTEEYRKRMEYELDVIIGLGFAEYLLIVADYIRFAKEKGKQINELSYPIGPGRGSAAGSIVCYLIGITSIDPMKYNLLFERFLNKDRVSMPDIDVDFSEEVRALTIEYVKEKYGYESTAYIRTATKQGGKSAIKNSARVRGYELYGPKPGKGVQDKVDDSDISSKAGNENTLTQNEWDEKMRSIRALGDKMAAIVDPKKNVIIRDEILEKFPGNEDARIILERAIQIEGTMTALSVHAAGIIIGDGQPLKNIVPLLYNTSLNQYAIQCDMNEAEHDLHLLKMDFLKLTNLDTITDAIRLIYKNHGVRIDPEEIEVEDCVMKELFSAGATDCVFQVESAGMKDMLKKFQPESMEDLILLVAAYRPGPMEFIPAIIDVKQGREKPVYQTAEMRRILSPTYGYPIYQEQLMDIFHSCAGFSLGEADIIRKAMSKKKVDQFVSYKDRFINGLIEHGFIREDAEKQWDSLTGFAEYAFNKSHAAAYAKITYITGWLKYHYPAEYLCAALNHARFDKRAPVFAECRRLGIKVSVPDVNKAGMEFSALTNGEGSEIVFGLARVKDMQKATAQDVIAERKNFGKYSDFTDFLLRTAPRASFLTLLAKCGALDSFGINREGVITYAEKICKSIEKITKQREEIKTYLSLTKTQRKEPKNQNKYEHAKITIENEREWIGSMAFSGKEIPSEILDYERTHLGYYVSSHPMERLEYLYKQGAVRIVDITEHSRDFAGIIRNYSVKKRKSDNSEFAVFTLEDMTGDIEVLCPVKKYNGLKESLGEGNIVGIKGKPFRKSDEDETYQISIRDARKYSRYKKPVLIYIDQTVTKDQLLSWLGKHYTKDGRPAMIYRACRENIQGICRYIPLKQKVDNTIMEDKIAGVEVTDGI